VPLLQTGLVGSVQTVTALSAVHIATIPSPAPPPSTPSMSIGAAEVSHALRGMSQMCGLAVQSESCVHQAPLMCTSVHAAASATQARVAPKTRRLRSMATTLNHLAGDDLNP
jgi:hypothetical protein